ncbi:hypothetical protein D9M68_854070 [compost metagenome]
MTDTKPDTEEKKPAAKKGKSDLVEVFNRCDHFFVQPSTGIRIGGKATAELKEDGWLRNQLSAGLMERV